jgi:hypothetical protein
VARTPFVWLGAGRAAKRGVARPGVLLDRLARAQLPVPQGAILLSDLYLILIAEGVIEQHAGRVYAPDTQWLWDVLYRDVRLPHLRATAVVRPLSESGEEGPGQELFATTGVDVEDPQQLSRSLAKAWSYFPSQGKKRRDLLLVEEVLPSTTGTVLLVDSRAPDIVSVNGCEEKLLLPRLGRWQRPAEELPPYARRLQMLVRGVRRTLGGLQCRLTWSDDGEICWITDVF